MLYGCAAAAAGDVVEQGLGRLAAHHQVGDPIGVLLVRIPYLPDSIFELNTGSLLHDVSSLMRSHLERRVSRTVPSW